MKFLRLLFPALLLSHSTVYAVEQSCPSGYHPVGYRPNSDGSLALVCAENTSGSGFGFGLGTGQGGALGGALTTGYDNSMFGGRGGSYSSNGEGQSTKEPSCSNPIMLATGNKVQPELDYLGKGQFPLSVSRTYNKAWSATGVFGRKWVPNIGRKLAFIYPSNIPECRINKYHFPGLECEESGDFSQPPSMVKVYQPGGLIITFTYDNDLAKWVDNNPDTVRELSFDGSHWTYKSEDNITEIYDDKGKILSRTNIEGITHTYFYDSSNRLTKITHASGRSLNFTWSGGRIVKFTDPAGNTYSYSYTNGLLTSVVRPGSPVVTRTYHYEDSRYPDALTGVSINGHRYSYFTYLNNNVAKSSYHAGGVDKYEFELSGNTTEVTNPLGHKDYYKFLSINGQKKLSETTRGVAENCPYARKSNTYDVNGFVDLSTDWNGNTTDYDYNEKGQLLKKTESIGTPREKISEYTWTESGNKLTHQITPEREIHYDYQADGKLASVSVTDKSAYGNYGEVRTTSYTYTTYASGIIKKVIVDGPRDDVSDVMTMEYDSKGNLIRQTNPLGQSISWSNYDALGNARRVSYPNGLVIDFTYDAQGKALTRTVHNSTGDQVTSYQYNEIGEITKETNALNQWTTYGYTSAYRLSQVSDMAGNKLKYTYNALGNITAQKIVRQSIVNVPPPGCWDRRFNLADKLFESNQLVSFLPVGNCEPVPRVVDIDYYAKYANFDVLGRKRADIGNNSQQTTYEYDNNSNVTAIIDSKGRKTRMAYNDLNQLISVTAPDGGVTRYTYNADGKTATVTDPRGLVTSYHYNGFGELVEQISPDTGTTTFRYNKGGQLIYKRMNNGKESYYSYDAAGRIKTETNGSMSRTYSYDNSSPSVLAVGRLWKMTDSSGSTYFYYDKVGNVIRKRSVIGVNSFNTYYSYDKLNRVTEETYPSGSIVSYHYDNLGNVDSVTWQRGSIKKSVATNMVYKPMGPLQSMQYGNGLNRTLSYDLDYRLTKIDNGSVQNLSYLFDNNNNITKITNSKNSGMTQTFGYDVNNRLASANPTNGTNTSWSYDKVGNRTKEYWNGNPAYSYIYKSSSNQLSKKVYTPKGYATWFSYNANGHTSQSGRVNLTYNDENRLSRATKGSTTATYTYNAMGQRVKKVVGSTTTHYLYNQAGQLIAEHSASGAVQKEYIYLGGQVIGFVNGSTLYYVHNDHLGRAEVITNSAKGIVWRANNYAFDRIVSTANITYNLGFPGQYYDAEKESWYNYFRDYDSKLGRYLQSDPIGLVGGINTYRYVYQNPVRYTDPGGLIGVCPALLIADAIVTTAGIVSLTNDMTNDEAYKKLRKIENNLKALEKEQSTCKDMARKVKIAQEMSQLNSEMMTLQSNLGASGITYAFGAGSLGLSLAAALACLAI